MRINVNDLKDGTIFYECRSGYNAKYILVDDVVINEVEIHDKQHKQYKWKALHEKSNTVTDFLITEGFEHYGPRLYTSPQYCSFKDGEMQFKLE